MRTPFAEVPLAPRDPILGLTEAFQADTRPTKVNLGVGVYTDESGKLPLLGAVREAERLRVEQMPARGYLPIDGLATYDRAVQSLLFGADSDLITQGRVCTAQAIGGTGALRIGADLLKRFVPDAEVWISDPSWENHRALFEAAGFKVNTYPYHDDQTDGVAFDAMKACLSALPARSIIVLHACCHNPTGADLSTAQWREVVALCKDADLVPFLDMAYQGFADGISEDGLAVRLFAESGLDFLVSSSFSKSFSLYGERVGALSVVCADKDESTRLVSQLKRVIRTNYSSPPTHGSAIVAAILTTPALRQQWEEELGHMRDRIRTMRQHFVAKLAEHAPDHDFSFIAAQRGMFSYSGLSSTQVDRLREEFGIYALSTGRICVAALNDRNIDYVVEAVAKVV
ncbi:MAG: aspartate/tyrosine/aromatic aminotransferase [Betaproteobacteria bacterium]|nr:aspartate/tyrosine/aromatic aminotransferase [Betaproteobacteria bacterium]